MSLFPPDPAWNRCTHLRQWYGSGSLAVESYRKRRKGSVRLDVPLKKTKGSLQSASVFKTDLLINIIYIPELLIRFVNHVEQSTRTNAVALGMLCGGEHWPTRSQQQCSMQHARLQRLCFFATAENAKSALPDLDSKFFRTIKSSSITALDFNFYLNLATVNADCSDCLERKQTSGPPEWGLTLYFPLSYFFLLGCERWTG